MNQLNKLIEQFTKEEDTPAFMIHALIREVEDEKGTWLNKLLEKLASRPTCGKEQRKFLDEVEKRGYHEADQEEGYDAIFFDVDLEHGRHSILDQSEFGCDLQKVIKGK